MESGLFIIFPKDPGHSINFKVFDGQDIYFKKLPARRRSSAPASTGRPTLPYATDPPPPPPPTPPSPQNQLFVP